MQSSNNQKTKKNINDIDYHLETLKAAIIRLQLDKNRDKEVYITCEKLIETLCLIEKLINLDLLQLPIKIATLVNDMFKQDENLSCVQVLIINTKRLFNPTSVGYLKLTV